jgi:hypothetical protein
MPSEEPVKLLEASKARVDLNLQGPAPVAVNRPFRLRRHAAGDHVCLPLEPIRLVWRTSAVRTRAVSAERGIDRRLLTELLRWAGMGQDDVPADYMAAPRQYAYRRPPSSFTTYQELHLPDTANPTSSYLTELLEDSREELTHADSKAALLLAATGVAVGALLSGLLEARWTPFALDNRIEWMWWSGVASAAAGIFCIAAAVYPRIRRRGSQLPGAPSYYGDVAAYNDIDAFRQAVEQVPSLETRLLDQTLQVSRIVQKKYVLVRRGLWFLLVATLACVMALVANIPLIR